MSSAFHLQHSSGVDYYTFFEKTIDFFGSLWYNISVKGRRAEPIRPMMRMQPTAKGCYLPTQTERQSLNSGIPVGATADRVG